MRVFLCVYVSQRLLCWCPIGQRRRVAHCIVPTSAIKRVRMIAPTCVQISFDAVAVRDLRVDVSCLPAAAPTLDHDAAISCLIESIKSLDTWSTAIAGQYGSHHAHPHMMPPTRSVTVGVLHVLAATHGTADVQCLRLWAQAMNIFGHCS